MMPFRLRINHQFEADPTVATRLSGISILLLESFVHPLVEGVADKQAMGYN